MTIRFNHKPLTNCNVCVLLSSSQSRVGLTLVVAKISMRLSGELEIMKIVATLYVSIAIDNGKEKFVLRKRSKIVLQSSQLF